MRTYQHTAFAVLGRCDVFYDGHKSVAFVCSGLQLAQFYYEHVSNVVEMRKPHQFKI
jgi:hypothetical protein